MAHPTPEFAFEENVSLAPLTSLGVGGPARFYTVAHSEEQIPVAVRWARERSLPLLVIGGGSNLLVSDRGFNGLVLRIGLRGLRFLSSDSLEAAAGEPWDALVETCVQRDWAGLECLSGIPGSTGGTPVQNVGAYGQEVAETIDAVRVWDCVDSCWREIPAAECQWEYRSSLFNRSGAGRFIIAAVRFRLHPGGPPALRYPELRQTLPGTPTLAETRAAVIAIRRSKAMVLDPGEPDCRSVGSFFKNPVVSESKCREIALKVGVKPPTFSAAAGVKIPAAWLIERSGFRRGYSSPCAPGAALSSRHVLAIVNTGSATAVSIVSLAREIRAAVFDRLGVVLQTEPTLVGFALGEGLD